MKKISMYIHIPFCESKCYYCDFNSYREKNEGVIRDYIDALIGELDYYREELKDYQIDTIFFGGGTPSSIDSKYIVRILDYIRSNYNTASLEEVSLESNPGSLTKDKIKDYKKAGINRVSLGLQTTNNHLLEKIGRTHSYEDFLKSYKMLKDQGINNINVDLMFALPDQKLRDVYLDLERVIELGVGHISYYSLILEEGTRLHEQAGEGRYRFPTDIEDRRMYHEIVRTLEENNYKQYEISNFSNEGFKCRHNLVYWEIEPYLGIGISSHSNIDGERFANTGDINRYIENLEQGKLSIDYREDIDKELEIAEYCIMGIRLARGINKDKFKARFKIDIGDIYGDVIKKHIKNGLLIEEEGNIFLSKRGKDLANLVEIDFI